MCEPKHGAAMGHVPVHAVPTPTDPHADPGPREAADLARSRKNSLLHTEISIMPHLWQGWSCVKGLLCSLNAQKPNFTADTFFPRHS